MVINLVSLNTPVLDFELADFTGKIVSLSALQGKNVVLVFNLGFF